MDDAQRRFLDRGADMIPQLLEKVSDSGQPTEFLLGERLAADGRIVRLVLRADVVVGTGSVSNGLATMEMPTGERRD